MMALENDPSARIQVRRLGELLSPGQCYVCGNGTCESGYVDFGTFVDYHGSFYLCMTCAKQTAEVIGYYSSEEVASIHAVSNEVAETNERLRTELEEARNVIDSLNTLRGSKLFTSSSGTDDVLPTDEAEQRDDDGPFKGSATGKSESTESVKGTGRRNFVRTTAGDTSRTVNGSD